MNYAAFALRWESAAGRLYSVYVCEDISKGWSATPVAEIEGTGKTIEYIPQQNRPAMFFKVTVRLGKAD